MKQKFLKMTQVTVWLHTDDFFFSKPFLGRQNWVNSTGGHHNLMHAFSVLCCITKKSCINGAYPTKKKNIFAHQVNGCFFNIYIYKCVFFTSTQ